MRHLYAILPAILCLILFTDCSKTKEAMEEQAPLLTITCPQDVTLTTPGNFRYYEYPESELYTNCWHGGMHVTRLSGPEDKNWFPLGANVVTQIVEDACGNSATCSFSVTVVKGTPIDPCNKSGTGLSDFRNALVGTYTGIKKCGAQPEFNHQVKVCYHPTQPNSVFIANDLVPLDTNCICFPWPYINGYREYHAKFFNGDSLRIFSQVYAPLGSPNQPPQCVFNGIK